MAEMSNQHSGMHFTLTLRLQEAADSRLLEGIVALHQRDHFLLRPTLVTFLPGDLHALRACLLAVTAGVREECPVANIDEDLILEISQSGSGIRYYVALWLGEPYLLMRGFRFHVERSAIEQFVSELRQDEE